MAGFPDEFDECTGFECDAGNADKNWNGHQVTQAECEQPFFNRPVVVAPSLAHSVSERRCALLGVTDAGRHLTIVFTVRGTLIRVISARSMSRQERGVYGRS